MVSWEGSSSTNPLADMGAVSMYLTGVYPAEKQNG